MSPALKVESPDFRFDDPSHTYYLGDKILPGITGILKECGYVDDRYYNEAARYRGQYVHWAVRLLNENDLDMNDVHEDYRGYVQGYQRFALDWNLKPQIFEKPMYHPELLFGGTPDMVGTVLDGIPAIIEWKTGPMPKWAALQTAAQELLARAWETRSPRRRRWGVTFNKDGTYKKPVEFKDWIRDEAVFRSLITTVQSKPLYGAKPMGATNGTDAAGYY